MGFSAHYLEDKNDAGQHLYNLIAGEFLSVKEAVKAQEVLKTEGYDSFYPKK
jgi:hypothetical protein